MTEPSFKNPSIIPEETIMVDDLVTVTLTRRELELIAEILEQLARKVKATHKFQAETRSEIKIKTRKG